MRLKIGILGGAEMARMLAPAGYPLGMSFRIYDPSPDTCAGQVVADHVAAGFDDKAALRRFAEGLDVVTYEWENVPVEAVRFLSPLVRVEPSLGALEVAQDRFLEKSLFRKLNIDTAPYAAVDSLDDLRTAAGVVGLPAVLKTRRLWYDGKGQFKLESMVDIEPAWRALGGEPLILEGFVPFRRELSILAVSGRWKGASSGAVSWRRISFQQGGPGPIVTRLTRQSQDRVPPRILDAIERARQAASLRSQKEWTSLMRGEVDFYPLVENVHRDGILRTSRAPAPDVTPQMQAEAESIAARIMGATYYIGVLAIELFEHEGRLLANEMAPGVHNSGHWTIEGAETSQFENHLRAVLGLPLGSTAARGVSAMLNLIGATPDPAAVLAVPGAHLHLYGKAPAPGRKLGHLTLRADEPGDLRRLLASLERLLQE